MDVLLGAYLLRYTLLGLLDTFFLRWIAPRDPTTLVGDWLRRLRRTSASSVEPCLSRFGRGQTARARLPKPCGGQADAGKGVSPHMRATLRVPTRECRSLF